jgi:hypothetical protein
MKIVIMSDSARKSLTDDEYKYLTLLEFSKRFEEGVSRIKEELGMPKPDNLLDLESLYDKTLALVLKLNIPISLLYSVEDIIRFGCVLRATPPILILDISNQFNRELLYNSNIQPKPSDQSGKDLWNDNNKKLLRNDSLAAAYPLIQINKRLNIEQLKKAVESNWNEIEQAITDFEQSSPYPAQLKEFTTRDIKDFATIYRYRKIQGLSSKETYKKLGKIYAEEDREIDRKYSNISKLLKELRFVED